MHKYEERTDIALPDIITVEGLFGSLQRQRLELADSLGCEIGAMGPAAEIVKADPITRETNVGGVYAVGDMGFPMQQITLAVAFRASAAAFVNQALCAEDAEDAEAVARSGLA